MTTAKYLHQELNPQGGTFLREFTQLPQEYKDWYRNAAQVEMRVLGVPVEEGK